MTAADATFVSSTRARSCVSLPLPEDHVLLPWHPQGLVRTRLNRKCAAVCSWLAIIQPGDLQSAGGHVSGPIMLDIASRISGHSAGGTP